MYVERTNADALNGGGVWRHSRDDAIFVGLSAAHAAVIAAALALAGDPFRDVMLAAVLAIGLWWNANTISHNFIHSPFFVSGLANRCYSVFLSLLLGVPQSLWRDRHIDHHAYRPYRIRLSRDLVIDAGAVIALWLALAWAVPEFFVAVYVPAYIAGMALCLLQGRFEHAPATTSHYGSLYNALFFNDGYHVEHHEAPDCHWTRLPDRRGGRSGSAFPAVLRWLECLSLTGLERLVLRSPRLRAFVLDRHRNSIRRLLDRIGPVGNVTVVGGGLFPRTVIVLKELMPHAPIRVIDASCDNIETARRFLAQAGIGDDIEFRHATFEPGVSDPSLDLLVTPLSLIGDRRRIYAEPPARNVLVHDWLWVDRTDASSIVSWWLLKRINLVQCGP